MTARLPDWAKILTLVYLHSSSSGTGITFAKVNRHILPNYRPPNQPRSNTGLDQFFSIELWLLRLRHVVELTEGPLHFLQSEVSQTEELLSKIPLLPLFPMANI
jgi:hypothetical protein